MKYESRVVLFLDILGFKQIIDKTSNKGIDQTQQIDFLYNTLIGMRKLFEKGKRYSASTQVTQFSDSVVVSFVEKEEAQVFYTLERVQKLITGLILEGLICRGGISYGKLIHTDQVIFGPALIQAYEMESNAAFFPRVVLDKAIIDMGKKYGFKPSEDDQDDPLMNMVKLDTDDMFYINYFLNKKNNLGLREEELVIYLLKLKNIIQHGLKFKNPSMRAKYGWMKNKFNRMLWKLQSNENDKISDLLKPLK